MVKTPVDFSARRGQTLGIKKKIKKKISKEEQGEID